MTKTTDSRARRTRRAVVQQGLGVLIVIFLVGFMVSKPFIEERLKRHGEDALAAAGIDGALDFTFQDARMLCSDRLGDLDAARRVVQGVDGVHAISFDRVCLDGLPDESTTTTPTTATSTTGTSAGTTAPTTAPTTVAPSTTAEPSTSTTVPEPDLSVSLADGAFTLDGAVASDEQRQGLLAAAQAALGAPNVADRLTVDDGAAVGDDTVSEFAQLIAAMPAPLAAGTLTATGATVRLEGVAVDQAGLDRLAAAAAAVGADTDLSVRRAASIAQARFVQDDLNDLVAAQPLQFGKGQATVSAAMLPTLQRLAGIAKRFSGMVVEVQGHTDSEGDPGRNLTLGEQRAAAVADALILFGVPAGDVRSRGFGETQLITDNNGAEIPELSRRVVFGVSLA